MSYLAHIARCTAHDLKRFAPFLIEGRRLGWVRKDNAALLAERGDLFAWQGEALALRSAFSDFAARSAALGEAAALLSTRHGIGLRGEMFPIVEEWHHAPLAQVDRAAVVWFGARGFGVHVNGFVRRPEGLFLWIAERAADRLVDAGKLDHIIAGGMPIGVSPAENVIKEAWEEAGVEVELAGTAKPIGALHYRVEFPKGLRDDTLFTFDLELPEGFTPRNTDGEVGRFMLLPAVEVAAIIRTTDRFKFNCNLVLIDFLLRHGVIGTKDEEYGALVEALTPLKERAA